MKKHVYIILDKENKRVFETTDKNHARNYIETVRAMDHHWYRYSIKFEDDTWGSVEGWLHEENQIARDICNDCEKVIPSGTTVHLDRHGIKRCLECAGWNQEIIEFPDHKGNWKYLEIDHTKKEVYFSHLDITAKFRCDVQGVYGFWIGDNREYVIVKDEACNVERWKIEYPEMDETLMGNTPFKLFARVVSIEEATV